MAKKIRRAAKMPPIILAPKEVNVNIPISTKKSRMSTKIVRSQ